jgi:O-antigen/teichoic acid export membrane protein
MAQLANTGLLISKNMKPAANLWFLGGALNIILNYFAIQTWGAYGAAVTSCFSFAFIYLGVMWKSLEFFRMDVVWRKLLGAGAIVLTCGVLMSPAWHRHPLASICLKLPLCVIVCLLAIRLIIPGWVRQIKEHLDEFRIRT